MQSRTDRYFSVLGNLPLNTAVTSRAGKPVVLQRAFDQLIARMQQTHQKSRKLLFIGNGGSAAIASHMAIDYSKNGGLRALAFGDNATITCLANDLGYENAYAKLIEMHAQEGDMLMAISSSGKSENILRAVKAASERNCFVVTFSGFSPDNPLREKGDFNFYVDSGEYGFVEITHLALCHCLLDLHMGWGARGVTAEEKALVADKALVA